MKGQILDYSIQTNSGIIVIDEGTRYTFTGADWKDKSNPSRGSLVDFIIEGDNAREIYLALQVCPQATQLKSTKTTLIHELNENKTKLTSNSKFSYNFTVILLI